MTDHDSHTTSAATRALTAIDGRASIVVDGRVVDIESATGGEFGSDPMEMWNRASEIWDVAAEVLLSGDEPGLDPAALTCAVPRPRQIFGVGLNYRGHATESAMSLPEAPLVFTKFASSLAGPNAEVPITGPAIDWEAELVAVVGTGGRDIAASAAFDHVAGLTAGQDVSDRILQLAGERPQFALAKSKRNHSPIGPVVVHPSSFDDVDDIELWCTVDGEEMQRARTSELIFDVATIIEYLSGIVELYPGDLIFTGTPAGVGGSRDPMRFLQPGETVTTGVAGIGEFSVTCVEG